MRSLTVVIMLSLLALAEARAAMPGEIFPADRGRYGESCERIVAILDHEPGVERNNPFSVEWPHYSHRFGVAGYQALSVACGENLFTEITIQTGFKTGLTLAFLSFWGRIAHDVYGADATVVADATQECVADALRNHTRWGKPLNSETLHVDCLVVTDGGISLSVAPLGIAPKGGRQTQANQNCRGSEPSAPLFCHDRTARCICDADWEWIC
jgi:hypothetical protein